MKKCLGGESQDVHTIFVKNVKNVNASSTPTPFLSGIASIKQNPSPERITFVTGFVEPVQPEMGEPAEAL